MKNTIILNFLSGINVLFGFILYLVIGKIYRLTTALDIYFSFYVFLNYIGYLVQIFWEGFAPYYAELKTKQGKEEADKLFSVLLNRTILVSFILIFVLIWLFPVVSKFYFKGKLTDFTFYVLFLPFLMAQNLFFLIKAYLQINFSFKMSYILDILSNLFPLIFIVIFAKVLGIDALVIGINLGFFLAGLIGLWYILNKLRYKYSIKVRHKLAWEIVKGSLWLKAGAFAYGAKDVIINNLLLGMGEGIVSAYSYASKFVSAVHLVVNAPVIMKFANEVMYMVSKKEFRKVKFYALKTSGVLAVLFILTATFGYFLIPILLMKFWKIKNSEIGLILSIYVLLTVFFFILCVEAPFARILTAFKKFNWGTIVNFLFLGVFLVSIKIFSPNLEPKTVIISLIIAQFFNLLSYYLLSAKLLSSFPDMVKEVK